MPNIYNVATGGDGSGASSVSISGSIPAYSIIVVLVTEGGLSASLGSLSDSAGNIYNLIASARPGGNNGAGGLFYSTTGNALNSQNITYTKSRSTSNVSISVVYVTGVVSISPLDSSVTASGTGDSASPHVMSGTPRVPGELFVAAVSYDTGTSFTQDSGHGWATPPNQGSSESQAQVAGGSQINSGVGALTFAPSLGAPANWAAFVVGFKPNSARGMLLVL
jgi:hypothetical protein